MIRATTLLRTADVTVDRFDHPAAHVHHDPAEEFVDACSISFVERGRFFMQAGRRTWELGPGAVFLTYPGMTYRCRHRESVPSDACLSVTYLGSATATPELAKLDRSARDCTVVPSTNRLAYLFRGLSSTASVAEAMAADSLAAALLQEVWGTPPRRLYRQRQLAWYAERVDAVRQTLEKRPADDHHLAALAGSVGMSTFHFARVFRELAGIPPHRYLLEMRLKEAAHRLRGGAPVTEACFASGFRNLSHFVRMFRRHFGVQPSRFARSLTARR